MKITYLLGAGASRNALPIVNEIPSRIKYIIGRIQDTDNQFGEGEQFENKRLPLTKKQALDYLIADLQWLSDKTSEHASVDTFAKKLYLKDSQNELKKLKVILSIYFILEQTIMPYDKRYDTFLASILEDSIYEFPQNIRIVSWNYDYQFEIAFSEYTSIKSISENQKSLNAYSKFSYKRHRANEFSIFKINGTTNFIDPNWKNEHEYCDSINTHLTKDILGKILENYTTVLYTDLKLFCNLSFAWETPTSKFDNIIQKTIEEVKDTSVLIVIGYSFPFFNRLIDREIINSLTNLNTVYFQAPDADNLKERFMAIRSNINGLKLITRFDIEQFLLPNEL